jgi:transposase
MQHSSEAQQDLILSAKQHQILEHIIKASTSSKSISKRASIILSLVKGDSKYYIVKTMGGSWPTVNKWKERWLEVQSKLYEIEKSKPEHELKKAIISLLKDAPRPGAPCTFTGEQVTKIIALACTSPESLGLPVSQWSCRLLAEYAQRQGIVETISYGQINIFLKSRGIKTA